VSDTHVVHWRQWTVDRTLKWSEYLSNDAFRSRSEVGGLVGLNYSGNVIYSYSVGTVSGSSYVGGLVGRNLSGTKGANINKTI